MLCRFLLIRGVRAREKSELGAHAEVGNGQQNDLLKHGVSAQLVAVVYVQIQLLETHREQMHDISYVQIEYPIVLLILHAEYGLHVVPQR